MRAGFASLSRASSSAARSTARLSCLLERAVARCMTAVPHAFESFDARAVPSQPHTCMLNSFRYWKSNGGLKPV